MKPQAPQRPLAYKNEQFIDSEDGRPLRILAEYLEPLQVFRRERIRDTIVFFGSARLAPNGPLAPYYAEARELARLITTWSKGLSSHAHRYIVCSGRRRRYHGGRQSRCFRCWWADHRTQHRLAA